MKTKNVVRRNLPINDSYVLVDSFYSEGENGSCCDNCNKYITNIAVIENSNKKQFWVGLDCAETLTNLCGLNSALIQFTEAKGIRAKVNKARKENKIVTFENTYWGKIGVRAAGVGLTSVDKDFCKKYLPDFYKAIINPDKNEFQPITGVNICTVSHTEAKQYFSTPKTYQLTGSDYNFGIKIYLTEGKKMDGSPNGSSLFTIDILNAGQIVANESTYMARDINMKIEYMANEYRFNQ